MGQCDIVRQFCDELAFGARQRDSVLSRVPGWVIARIQAASSETRCLLSQLTDGTAPRVARRVARSHQVLQNRSQRPAALTAYQSADRWAPPPPPVSRVKERRLSCSHGVRGCH